MTPNIVAVLCKIECNMIVSDLVMGNTMIHTSLMDNGQLPWISSYFTIIILVAITIIQPIVIAFG